MDGRILKGTGTSVPGASASGSRVLKQDVLAAREEGRHLVAAAQEEAEQIRAEALREAEQLREQARRQGYEDGIARLNELALSFQETQSHLFEESRSELIRLGVRVAEKILGRELEVNEAALTDLVIRAIRGIRHERRIQIRVAPEDLERVRAGHPRLIEEVGAGKEIEFREDPTIKTGGCIVETDLGIIDARLDTQLRVLERALLAKRG